MEARIRSGDIPQALRGELRAGAQRLLDLIPVPPPPPPEPAPPAPPPPPTPEEDPCASLEEELAALEGEIEQLPKDDPSREALEAERDAVKEALKDCEREDRGGGNTGEGNGDGGDGGEDDD